MYTDLQLAEHGANLLLGPARERARGVKAVTIEGHCATAHVLVEGQRLNLSTHAWINIKIGERDVEQPSTDVKKAENRVSGRYGICVGMYLGELKRVSDQGTAEHVLDGRAHLLVEPHQLQGHVHLQVEEVC